ncbi:hypothetical protein EVAR_59788_1 [Eumeta japonica]|uniref:Uncharacterized protein n=1 Tax=Eumeta variegata TaxID=151549 RepID=A0A4C1YF14_EUMVA|nr:hypothetical protein EVAR_59788_1 [Eumeta japonica]
MLSATCSFVTEYRRRRQHYDIRPQSGSPRIRPSLELPLNRARVRVRRKNRLRDCGRRVIRCRSVFTRLGGALHTEITGRRGHLWILRRSRARRLIGRSDADSVERQREKKALFLVEHHRARGAERVRAGAIALDGPHRSTMI